MKVAVFDTYVKKKDRSGSYHFDIIVEKDKFSSEEVFNFGKQYLAGINAEYDNLSVDECQFCHIEIPSDEMVEAIQEKNYFILVFEDIPSVLEETSSRTKTIQYLRAKHEALRFKDFSSYSMEDILELLNTREKT